MGKKKTHEEFIEEIKYLHPNIRVLTQYTGHRCRIQTKCSIHNYEWETSPRNLKEGHGCPKCGGTCNLTNKEFLEKLNSIRHDITPLEEYINARTEILCKCNTCNHEWKVQPNNILCAQTGCPNCKRNKISLNKDEVNKRLKEINPTVELIGEYINNYTHTEFKCAICGNIWKTKPSHVLYNLTGCPKCCQSKGEKQISLFLDGGKIEYIPQYRLDSSQFTQSRINIDFYLPNYNTIIEYNGKQHYEIVDFGDKDWERATLKFERQSLRDKELREYCKNNNIKLIEIPYTVKLQDIPNYLKEKLCLIN